VSKIPVDVICIGFQQTPQIERVVTYLNSNQQTFTFILLRNSRFIEYSPQNDEYFTTEEIYTLMDMCFKDLSGFHHLAIGLVEHRLDGKKYGNLFGSMQTNENDGLTGKAICTSFGMQYILQSIPIEIYYIFELISFSIRFIVGYGMIHDRERGCLFHRKVAKHDIIEAVQSGYISLECLNIIDKKLEFEHIQAFKNMLSVLGYIARSENPEQRFETHFKSPPLMKNNTRTKIFISYSHKDKAVLQRLKIQIRPFEQKGLIEAWDDSMITPGMIWRDEIQKALNSAKVAIILVSPDFLASDFIALHELPPLLVAAKEEGVKIFPVIISPCLYEESDLGQFQAVNPISRTFIEMLVSEQERLLVTLVRAIKRSLEI